MLFAGGGQVEMGASGAVRPRLFPEIPKGFQGRRLEGVVRVQKGDALPRRMLQPQVPGGGHAAVGLVEYTDAGVPGGIAVAQGGRAVPAAVVDQQQLPVRKGLGQHAVHALGQQLFRLIDRYDHRNGRHKPPPFKKTE